MTDGTPGFLVAVEGVDGSGKSTQIRLLHTWLQSLGCKVHFSEWNSSDLVKDATKRGKKGQLLTPTTFSLIHATDFADRYERQILPRLQAGWIVLCDRYKYTAFARDRVRGCEPAWLTRLYSFAQEPDLTFYYDVPLDVSLQRILSGRPRLKYHEAGMDLDLHSDIRESFKIFQGRIMTHYLEMAGQYPFVRVDANEGIHTMQQRMRSVVQERIDLSRYQRNRGGAP
ncbi:MAG: dTMP kinase [Thermoplasmata archaeon]|jgi:dTMP kinase|nr:dTMP kinase [Thermoplasmata archaeon]